MLAEIITQLAEFEREDNKFRPRPSLAGEERCSRQMVYWGLGLPRKPMPGRAILIFSDSSFHEDLTLDWLRKSAYKIHSDQMEVDCPAPMRKGRIDGVVTDTMSNDYLLEHKAISHFSFNHIWDGRMPVDYFTQMAIYFWGLQKVNPDIEQGILLIKNKNTGQYMEFKMTYDRKADLLTVTEKVNSVGDRQYPNVQYKDIVKNACDKFNRVLECIEKKHLPKKTYDLNHWQCQYCGWGQVCWEDYQKEFNEMTTDAALSQDIEDACAYFKQTQMHESEMKKERDQAKGKVIELIKGIDVREGRTESYLVALKLQTKNIIDKTLLTEEELAKCTKQSQSESLSIRLLKPKEPEKPKPKQKQKSKPKPKQKRKKKGG